MSRIIPEEKKLEIKLEETKLEETINEPEIIIYNKIKNKSFFGEGTNCIDTGIVLKRLFGEIDFDEIGINMWTSKKLTKDTIKDMIIYLAPEETHKKLTELKGLELDKLYDELEHMKQQKIKTVEDFFDERNSEKKIIVFTFMIYRNTHLFKIIKFTNGISGQKPYYIVYQSAQSLFTLHDWLGIKPLNNVRTMANDSFRYNLQDLINKYGNNQKLTSELAQEFMNMMFEYFNKERGEIIASHIPPSFFDSFSGGGSNYYYKYLKYKKKYLLIIKGLKNASN